ncbi:MAG: phosphogluconate dehydrogenase (NAD(+)-dependent, decarboxylating) [Candidatus Woesearchaeota archaeon]
MKHEIGFIGLGRMGGNMVQRMLDNGSIHCVIWNRTQEKMDPFIAQGAKGVKTIPEVVSALTQRPKIVWLMLPSGKPTEDAFTQVCDLLEKDDIVIDGANSNFHDTLRRHEYAKQKGLRMLDIGVSGGIVAANTGYPMMIGGEAETYAVVKPILESFGYQNGFALVGPGGSGHYVKMIHNAIEYGMMQAISEGFDLLQNGRFKDLDLQKIAQVYNNGCVVDGFLMKMTEQALQKDPKLGYLKPYVDDSGEGRWSAIEAMEHGVPFVVNTYALHARYISRDDDSFAFKMLAAQRNEFGGHAIKQTGSTDEN